MRRLAFLLLLLASGCITMGDLVPTSTPTPAAVQPATSAAATPTAAPSNDLPTKEAALAQVLATVETQGCASVAECRTLPAGAKACGGPSRYVVYCSKTTNEELLKKTIDTYTSAEREYNIVNDVISDCAMKMPPELALTDGECATK